MRAYCAGLINGLSAPVGVCPPVGVTPEQVLRVVVQYIDQRPARTNESFKLLVTEAMRDAWPCNH